MCELFRSFLEVGLNYYPEALNWETGTILYNLRFDTKGTPMDPAFKRRVKLKLKKGKSSSSSSKSMSSSEASQSSEEGLGNVHLLRAMAEASGEDPNSYRVFHRYYRQVVMPRGGPKGIQRELLTLAVIMDTQIPRNAPARSRCESLPAGRVDHRRCILYRFVGRLEGMAISPWLCVVEWAGLDLLIFRHDQLPRVPKLLSDKPRVPSLLKFTRFTVFSCFLREVRFQVVTAMISFAHQGSNQKHVATGHQIQKHVFFMFVSPFLFFSFFWCSCLFPFVSPCS